MTFNLNDDSCKPYNNLNNKPFIICTCRIQPCIKFYQTDF